jgi:farnesyl diphosphate synthase
MAILAGDALQALAFEAIARASLPAVQRVDLLTELAIAAGARGMCGGQALDIDATGNAAALDVAALQRLHALKTGALLRAAVRLGAIGAGVDAPTRDALDRYADALGLAFQVRDDLLDVEGDSATLGKTAGKDAAQAKATFPALLGLDASRARLRELADAMNAALAPFGDRAAVLAALARQVVERDR